jgi:putative ABC transport system permease protein
MGFISYSGVEPGYFRLMGMRIAQGTTFTDTSTGAAQVIINEGMARRHWSGQSALGRRLRIANVGKSEWRTIIGVVADASTSGLTSEASEPMLYMPPSSIFRPAIVVRTTGSARPMPQLRALVASIDPGLAPPTISSVADMMAKSVAGPRFTMLLLGVFTVLALILAAVGLYGVMAYSVAQRTREIGIRIALGATTRHIGRRVVRQGAVLALLGVLIGLVGANWATRLIERMLYGVPRTDPASFAVGGLLLLGTALLACVVPMRRAVRVDPVIAMHAE